MSAILIFDTETTGLPDWKIPSDSPTQPHLVQLAAILADEETRKEICSIDLIIRPDGWEVTPETTEVHGITTEYATAHGVAEKTALHLLMDLHQAADKRVAHNRTFDQRIIRIGLKRYGFDDETLDNWASTENFDCTMLLTKPLMMLEPKGRYGYKNPKLSEAYEFYTGKPLEDAHSAMADTRGCMAVYWALKDQGLLT